MFRHDAWPRPYVAKKGGLVYFPIGKDIEL